MRDHRSVRIAAFELKDPIPELNDPIVIGTLIPWLDAGRVGTLALSRLEEHLRAVKIAELAVPGRFFDFTRYRPTTHYAQDQRAFTIPNSTLSYSKGQSAPDILLFQVMEPHMFAEEYVEAIVEVLRTFGVRRHCRVGAWYDAVPHTRPLPVSYSVGGQQVDPKTGESLPRRGRYEGPTSILNLVTDSLERIGIDNQSLMVRLPYYARLEEDHTGAARLLEGLLKIFELPSTLSDAIRSEAFEGQEQYQRLSAQVADSPEVRSLLQQLEAEYDSEATSTPQEDGPPRLSPDVEQFLKEINTQLGGEEEGGSRP